MLTTDFLLRMMEHHTTGPKCYEVGPGLSVMYRLGGWYILRDGAVAIAGLTLREAFNLARGMAQNRSPGAAGVAP